MDLFVGFLRQTVISVEDRNFPILRVFNASTQGMPLEIL